MFDFLAETLASDAISNRAGETATVHWSRPEAGVIVFQPRNGYRQNIIISVAIHGNETAPIEIVNRLIHCILNDQYCLTNRVMVIVGNLAAMRQGERYLNIDLNRLFSDHYQRYQPCYETERAARLQQLVAEFYAQDETKPRLHLDLHTAIRASCHPTFALLPYLDSGHYHPEMINWLQSIGLHALVVNHAPASTFSYFSSAEFGANSCTLELGKAKPFQHNELREFAGIEQGLIKLICAAQPLPSAATPAAIAVYQVADVIVKHSERFQLNVADDVKNFTAFASGYLLATDGDIDYRVQQTNGYILFPNRHVKVGLRAGLLLKKAELATLIGTV